jgi:hypothetical protein
MEGLGDVPTSKPTYDRTPYSAQTQDRDIGLRDDRVWQAHKHGDHDPRNDRRQRQFAQRDEKPDSESAAKRSRKSDWLVLKLHWQHRAHGDQAEAKAGK